MRRKVATAIVMLALVVMAGVPANADAASPDQTKSDLSSLPEIEAYLFSIGVDPGSVVVQQGRLNYAGPNCPGAGWNCTTANMVVQISTSTSPGANIFDCLPTLNAVIPALNECLIVQSSVLSPTETAATTNLASCSSDISGDGRGKSKCTVRQSSKKGNNYAEVRARITQRDEGSLQTATQDAKIEQVSDGGRNTAKITQTVEQTLTIERPDDPTQKQESHQTAKVDQTSGTGANSSDVQQTLLQVENAQTSASTTQEQNTDVPSTGNRNQEATVNQTSTSGTNTSNLRHQLTQRQDADTSFPCGPTNCTVTQTQGSLYSSGQRGVVKQTTGPVVITSTAAQNEDQTQDADTAGALVQNHYGPQDCCAEQIGGTSDNVNQVDQVSTQQNDPEGFATSEQNGTCTENSGAQCTVHQTITQNGTPSHNDCPPPSTGSCLKFHSCNSSTGCVTTPPSLLRAPPDMSPLGAYEVPSLALREPVLGAMFSVRLS